MKTTPIVYFIAALFLGTANLAKAQTMLTGKIVDSAGNNLHGCGVRVCGCDKRDSSDRDGVYRIYVNPGKYQLEVFRAGLLVRRRIVEIPAEDFYELDFVLPSE